MLEKLKHAQIKQFFIEVRLEMRKVSWPGRREVYGTTVVVVFAVFFFGAYLGLIDVVLQKGVESIFKLFK